MSVPVKRFEERIRHEENLRFKITARSNRLFGERAAARLGLLKAQGDDYANSVVHSVRGVPASSLRSASLAHKGHRRDR
jgi:hypothetical protein